MPGIEFDPEILQEFLTECGELLDALESDLVQLESNSSDTDLLNQVFRALHTIKGSASFLALTELVEIAHAAETALNAARNGDVTVDQSMMDMLLRAVDIIKQQMGEIQAGSALTRADEKLTAGLTAIGEGGPAPTPDAPASATDGSPSRETGGPGERPLALDDGKSVLLDHFVADLDAQLARLGEQLDALMDDQKRSGVADTLDELGQDLTATIDFFELDSMGRMAQSLIEAAAAAAKSAEFELDQALPRMRALLSLIGEQKAGLGEGKIVEPDAGALLDRLAYLASTGHADDGWRLPAGADPTAALALDRGGEASTAPANAPATTPATVPAAAPAQAPAAAPARAAAPAASGEQDDGSGEGQKSGGTGKAAAVEKTLRVEVGRLESLMNLVGELVLQKNRISELSRRVAQSGAISPEIAEPLELAGAGLDRLTGEIQVAVMRTRMQPLDKLFGKYPRLIRDLSRKTGKELRLEIIGGETEVDRQVIEELGDPLVHILRNSADHGIEMPDVRQQAGKPREGTITLAAAHQGNNAVITISDNGKGLHRDTIGGKAIERGLATEAEVAQMSDTEVFRFIFAAGFSTAAQVSDLSGRGVGMDVVRTNIERLKGTIDVTSTPGQGTTLTIHIPLTVAILPAMMVRVCGETYAIPLSHILEIVRPGDQELSTILEERVIRLRGSVFPLLDAGEKFDAVRPEGSAPAELAVVLNSGDRTAGLLVDEVIGQQEIVIKPLDGLERTGPFSGATVRNDGAVSLIVDVTELIRAS